MNRAEFFQSVQGRPAEELEMIQNAYWISKEAHRAQKRDGGERYFNHPRAVASLLLQHGHSTTPVLVAALLHDVVEDTNAPFKILFNLFGSTTWSWLQLLSKQIPVFDPLTGQTIGRLKKDTAAYYGAIRAADRGVRLVKVADRLHNMSDMANFTEDRRRKYLEETCTYILPIAQDTCPRLYVALGCCCGSVEQSLMAATA